MAIKDDMQDVQEAVINELITENGIANTLADGQVTADKIATDAVGSRAIATSAVGSGELASNAVTNGKIANGAVTAAKLGSDVSLTPADGSITPAKLDRAYLESTGGSVSGNLGVGTSSPSTYAGTAGTTVLAVGSTSGNNGVNVISGTTSTGSYMFSDSDANDRGGFTYFHTADLMTVKTAGSEAMRITADGHVILANVPTSSSGLSTGTIYSDGGTLKIKQ